MSSRVAASARGPSGQRNGRERRVDITCRDGVVPSIWLTPGEPDTVPAVLLLHGLSSNKERMASAIGSALLTRGVASLSIDLPMHGARATPDGKSSFSNPLALVGAWRAAVSELDDVVTWMEQQPEVVTARLGVVGYSLGGFLALMAAADDPRLRVVALAASGDLPDATPYAAMVRRIVDPPRAARRIAGRPLLLVNGRYDTTTRPVQAERLYAAAAQPKTMLWYEGGHWPPAIVIGVAADWVAARLDAPD